MKKCGLHMVAFCLVIIGGLNLGLAALGFDVVNMILGGMPTIERVLYILVGLSAAYLAVTQSSKCKSCK